MCNEWWWNWYFNRVCRWNRITNDFNCIIIEVERGIIIGIISGKIVVIAHWDVFVILLGILLDIIDGIVVGIALGIVVEILVVFIIAFIEGKSFGIMICMIIDIVLGIEVGIVI